MSMKHNPAMPDDEAVASGFYHLAGVPLAGRSCAGLACFAARADAPARWADAAREPRVHCLGKCYTGPAVADTDSKNAVGGPRPHVEVCARHAVLLGNVQRGGARTLAEYLAAGGGRALDAARVLDPATIVAMVRDSGLRGRGGAGFPTGEKWLLVAAAGGPVKHIVANADEGDPGAFSDRFLIEDDPFRLIEAMVIAARATGASRGHIYLRREYPACARVLEAVLAEARLASWLGSATNKVAAPGFDIELVVGHGSYVCGEETAMLNAIEGRLPQVRLRPPQITERGLHGQPTLVNNVETLCAVPWIVAHGAAAYAALGFSKSRGTKLLSLNSLFRRPGLYEVEFGITLREIVEELGGGLKRGRLQGLMIGGPLAGLVPPSRLDTRLGYEEMHAVHGAVGHGGVIAFADDTSLAAIAAEIFRFGADESCGKCVPCHRGTPQLARMYAGEAAREPVHHDALLRALADTSLCAHGRGLAEFGDSLKANYPDQLAALFRP